MLTNEQIDSRFGLFTASEIHRLLSKPKGGGGLFGDGAMTYIYEKVAECITGETKPQTRAAATDWGIEHEADAIAWFEMTKGIKGEHFGVNNFKFFKYNDKSGCSPDWVCAGVAGLQVKCPYLSANHVPYLLSDKSQAWLKEYNKEYYTQTQFEMMCLKKAYPEMQKMYFATYDPRTIEHYNRMAIFEMVADVELHTDLDTRIKAASEIVSKCVGSLKTSFS